MILQLMSNEDMPDASTSKGCQIIDKVREVTFRRGPNQEPLLDVSYEVPHRGVVEETLTMMGNSYLLNDNGKTVHSFAHTPGA